MKAIQQTQKQKHMNRKYFKNCKKYSAFYETLCAKLLSGILEFGVSLLIE